MKAFVWNALFETGIHSVDEQHRKLVEIINRLGASLVAGATSSADIDQIYAELTTYALQHFADEERLMDAAALDAQHCATHHLHHAQFVEQLGELWSARSGGSHQADALLGFLTSWLTFHILAEDQSMARQIALVRAGVPAAQAIEGESAHVNKGSTALVGAMRELYRVLSLQNAALSEANARLEDKVRERTRELVQSEKMAAIGQLAAGVAHEINNPIGFVRANVGTLGRYTGQLFEVIDAASALAARDAGMAQQWRAVMSAIDLAWVRQDWSALMQETQEGLERVSQVVGALQDYASVDTGLIHDADMLAGLESTLVVVASQLRQKALISRELTPLPPVPCAPGLINQVFMNLLVNAAQAIADHGQITLRSGFDDDEVWVEVTDTGCGIQPEQLPHLFEPFYTTHPVGQGAGLGLSVAWDIVVKQHGGRIDVRSQPGAGSSFRVWLPRRRSQSASRPT